MKNTYIRNSFVAPHNIAPSGPADVLANGNRRGYIAPVNNGILPELQEFVVTASGSVDDQAIITISGGDKTYESESGAGKPIDASIQVRGAGYHDVSVKHVNIDYPPKGNISYIHCTLSGIAGAAPVPDKNDRETTCADSRSCSIDGMGSESGGPNGSAASSQRMSGGYASTSGGYTIAIYPPAQVVPPAGEGGLFTTTGDPVKTFTVSGGEEAKSLTIAERDWTLPESMPDFVSSWNFAGGAWSLATGAAPEAVSETRTRTDLADGRYSVETVLAQGGVEAAHALEIYEGTDEGKLLLSSTEAYGTDEALTTTYTYNDQGQLVSENSPNGATTAYRYDAQGRPTKVSTPWGAAGTRCVETTYRTDAEPYSSEPAQVRTRLLTVSGRSTLRTDDYTYTTENGIKREEVRSTAAGTSGTQLTVTETYGGDVENTFTHNDRSELTAVTMGAKN